MCDVLVESFRAAPRFLGEGAGGNQPGWLAAVRRSVAGACGAKRAAFIPDSRSDAGAGPAPRVARCWQTMDI